MFECSYIAKWIYNIQFEVSRWLKSIHASLSEDAVIVKGMSWLTAPGIATTFLLLKSHCGSASLNQRPPAVEPFVDFYILIHHGVQIIFLSGFSHDPLDLFFLNIQRHSAKLHTFG